MATIFDLLEDIINIILCPNNISVQDCVNFSSTCTHFHQMIGNLNIVWQRQLYQRWPRLIKLCEKEKCKRDINFKELIKTCIKCKEEVQHLSSLMRENPINYCDAFIKYELLCEGISKNATANDIDLNLLLYPDEMTHTWNYYFFIDELIEWSQNGCGDNLINISNGFNNKLALYLEQYDLKSMWQEFIKRPAELQLLEEGAILIAQWFLFKKNISYSHIKTELNNIAQKVMKHLKSEHPMHPIFSASDEQLSFWQDNNIYENQWSNSDGKQILDILCKLLSKLNFHACSQNTTFIREYLLDYMLKDRVGYLISLGIVFQSVARRLGIRCDLIFSQKHCFLYWKPKYNITNSGNEQCFYIDVLYNGTFLYTNDCIETDKTMRYIRSTEYETYYETQNAYEENAYEESAYEHARINSVKLILKLINFLSYLIDFYNVTLFNESCLYESRLRCLELHHVIKPDNLYVIKALIIIYENDYRRNTTQNDQKLLLSTLIFALKKVLK